MARSIWDGSITFGLVNIPVKLHSAEKREEVAFHLLDKKNMARVKNKRVNEETGREVDWDDIVRGYEFESGKYVVISDEDLERASPEKTKTIDIVDFVDQGEISPLYFDKPYYLAPDESGAKSYALLREALKRTEKVGIAKVVIRSKEHLAAVFPQDDVIVLNLLRFSHELNDTSSLDLSGGKKGVTDRELDMAERLIEGMVGDWDPEQYRDDYYKDLMKLIDERVKAGQLEESPEAPPAEKPERSNVVDLMELLKRSLDQPRKEKAPAKAAPAKKSAAKPAAKKTAKKPASRKSGSSRRRKTA